METLPMFKKYVNIPHPQIFLMLHWNSSFCFCPHTQAAPDLLFVTIKNLHFLEFYKMESYSVYFLFAFFFNQV